MTSVALQATVLIAVDAHAGEWRPLSWLAQRVIAPVHVVQLTCDQLVERGLLQFSMTGGERCYGVQCEVRP